MSFRKEATRFSWDRGNSYMPDPNNPHGLRGIYINPDADISWVRCKYFDIPYGHQSFCQKMDIYLPCKGPASKGYPLVVFIHGGAWMMCDKRDIQLNPVLSLLHHGIAVASINYRLSGEARFPAQIYDVKAAIRFLRGNCNEYSLNTEKIAVWGMSSGAHLAALTGTSAGIVDLEDLSLGNQGHSSAVQAVISWFGPTDFLMMDSQFQQSGKGIPDHSRADSPESLLLGNKISEIPDMVRKADPQTWLTRDCPPFLLQHGDSDEIVPYEQSVIFSDRIRAAAGEGKAELTILPGARHADSRFENDSNLEIVWRFLNRTIL